MQDVQGEETKDIEMKKDTIIQKKKNNNRRTKPIDRLGVVKGCDG